MHITSTSLSTVIERHYAEDQMLDVDRLSLLNMSGAGMGAAANVGQGQGQGQGKGQLIKAALRAMPKPVSRAYMVQFCGQCCGS